MTIKEFDALVSEAYDAAFSYEADLVAVYERAYFRQGELAAKTFETITAAWTPPIIETLTYGMSEEEAAEADRVRDEAAAAILAVFATLGLAAFAVEFLRAISNRAQANFEQEILRNLRKIVADGFNAGLSSAETAAMIRERIPQVIPSSAEMLAQTELTALVNERSLAAANKQFPDAMKTWLTVGDNRVRVAHAHAQGQTVPINDPFQVGGSALMYPGDPMGPLRLTARCRCRLSYSDAPAVVASAQEDTLMSMTDIDPLVAGISITIEETEDEENEVEVEESDEMVMEDGATWRALLAIEGVPTEDGRMLAEGSLTWRDLPLSLMAMDETSEGGHLGAKVAGRIDNIWRDGNEVWGEGVFNTDEFGSHIQELVSNQSLRGNSIDPAVTAYEYRDAESGDVLDGDALMDAMMNERPILTVFLEAIIMASTVCSTPAIGEANIVLASGLLRTVWFQTQPEDALTASAAGMAPVHPPAAWFDNPGFRELTPLTVTDDGRVMGHAAGWNTCHVGEPHGAGVCVTPPRSGMGYEVFHHGAVQTAEGHDVSVGHITMSTSHADSGLGWKAAQDHYDNSGAVVADVRAGEDRFGIWVSGALRPDLPAARVREMKAGSISGDWRSVIGRGLEFISALIVNIPGFPIPRPQATIVASAAGTDEVESLVAAGIVECDCVEGMSHREYLRKIRSFAA